MRARESGIKRNCICCGTPTLFQWEQKTPRGAHVRFWDCCWKCGEQPALTDKLKATA